MAFLLSLTLFCLFSVLFCSTYCVPIESIGEIENDWENGFDSANIGLRAPGLSFGYLAQMCQAIYRARTQKFICLLCTGFNPSCLLAVPQQTTTTLSLSTTPTFTPPTTPPTLFTTPLTTPSTLAPTTITTTTVAPEAEE